MGLWVTKIGDKITCRDCSYALPDIRNRFDLVFNIIFVTPQVVIYYSLVSLNSSQFSRQFLPAAYTPLIFMGIRMQIKNLREITGGFLSYWNVGGCRSTVGSLIGPNQGISFNRKGMEGFLGTQKLYQSLIRMVAPYGLAPNHCLLQCLLYHVDRYPDQCSIFQAWHTSLKYVTEKWKNQKVIIINLLVPHIIYCIGDKHIYSPMFSAVWKRHFYLVWGSKTTKVSIFWKCTLTSLVSLSAWGLLTNWIHRSMLQTWISPLNICLFGQQPSGYLFHVCMKHSFLLKIPSRFHHNIWNVCIG